MKLDFKKVLTTTFIYSSLFIIVVLLFLYNLYQYFSKSYIINEKDFYSIGYFRKSGEVFSIGRKEKAIEFQSENQQIFKISDEVVLGIIDKKRVFDSLEKNTYVEIFTTKKSREKFLANKEQSVINVYQAKQNGYSFINFDELNKKRGNGIFWSIFITGLLFPIIIYVSLKSNTGKLA